MPLGEASRSGSRRTRKKREPVPKQTKSFGKLRERLSRSVRRSEGGQGDRDGEWRRSGLGKDRMNAAHVETARNAKPRRSQRQPGLRSTNRAARKVEGANGYGTTTRAPRTTTVHPRNVTKLREPGPASVVFLSVRRRGLEGERSRWAPSLRVYPSRQQAGTHRQGVRRGNRRRLDASLECKAHRDDEKALACGSRARRWARRTFGRHHGGVGARQMRLWAPRKIRISVKALLRARKAMSRHVSSPPRAQHDRERRDVDHDHEFVFQESRKPDDGSKPLPLHRHRRG